MRLSGRQLLLLVTDGVDEEEVEDLKNSFEGEGARVFITTPGPFLTVETVRNNRRGRDLVINFPFEAVDENQFSGLIIPDGLLSADALRKDQKVVDLVFAFFQNRVPICASGKAVELLYESHVLSQQVVVREGTPLETFVNQAVGVLLDHPPARDAHLAEEPEYRPTR